MIVPEEQGSRRIVNFGTRLMENSDLRNRLLQPREIMGSKFDGFRSYHFEEEWEDVQEETKGLSKERGLDLVVAHQVEERTDSWNKSKFEEFNKFLGFSTTEMERDITIFFQNL